MQVPAILGVNSIKLEAIEVKTLSVRFRLTPNVTERSPAPEMTSRVILLEGGPPWGFRMTSGAENSNIPLKISRVNPGSKAAQKGIREGDIITSINGQPSMKLNPTEAQKLLKQAGANLKLGLNENGVSKKSDSRTRPKTQGELILWVMGIKEMGF
ncbi:hypothetical protein WDU94_011361 [Cyamophila willieti]